MRFLREKTVKWHDLGNLLLNGTLVIFKLHRKQSQLNCSIINPFHAKTQRRNIFSCIIIPWQHGFSLWDASNYWHIDGKAGFFSFISHTPRTRVSKRYSSFKAWKGMRHQVPVSLPSLFMPICRHFLSRQAWHWFLCALSTMQRPVPAWHLRTVETQSLTTCTSRFLILRFWNTLYARVSKRLSTWVNRRCVERVRKWVIERINEYRGNHIVIGHEMCWTC
jgi:hypothetical protein